MLRFYVMEIRNVSKNESRVWGLESRVRQSRVLQTLQSMFETNANQHRAAQFQGESPDS